MSRLDLCFKYQCLSSFSPCICISAISEGVPQRYRSCLPHAQLHRSQLHSCTGYQVSLETKQIWKRISLFGDRCLHRPSCAGDFQSDFAAGDLSRRSVIQHCRPATVPVHLGGALLQPHAILPQRMGSGHGFSCRHANPQSQVRFELLPAPVTSVLTSKTYNRVCCVVIKKPEKVYADSLACRLFAP